MIDVFGLTYHVTYTSSEAIFVGLLVIWELFWKGIALWKAGNNKQSVWFVALLILNTLGLLEIIYLLFFQRKKIIKNT